MSKVFNVLSIGSFTISVLGLIFFAIPKDRILHAVKTYKDFEVIGIIFFFFILGMSLSRWVD